MKKIICNILCTLLTCTLFITNVPKGTVDALEQNKNNLSNNVCVQNNNHTLDCTDFSVSVGNGIVYEFSTVSDCKNTTLVNERIYSESDDSIRIVRNYADNTGKILEDIVTISRTQTRSSSGRDVVTRETHASNFATVGITASFEWDDGGVECLSMAAYYVASSGDVVCQYFNRSRSEGVVSIGKAYAQVSYKFYNSLIPVQSSSGKFKITCSDEGTISDNGN